MELINFNGFPQNARLYGGSAGRKIGITYQGKNYLLKFPGNLKEKSMKNVCLSYSNSPICEYLGSQIYSLLGIQVHDTLMGERNGKIVVACHDFLEDGDRLFEFDKAKVTYEPLFLDSNGNETNGAGVDLYEVIMTIKNHPFLEDISGVIQRFWDMFVVDALIGNSDRNNLNWGFIVEESGKKRIAPVYDNGNCLNNKWDDEKIRAVLEDSKEFEAEAYKRRQCIFELKGRRINPYQLIAGEEYNECTEAVKRITPMIKGNMHSINSMIYDAHILSDIQKEFFVSLIKERYERVLLPVYQRTFDNKIGKEKGGKILPEKGKCR